MTAPHVDDRCPDHGTLSRAVANAIKETYQRKAAYEDAKANKKDTPQTWAALQVARDSELKADQAFRDHVKEHGCKQ
jgi:hypothetical protein